MTAFFEALRQGALLMGVALDQTALERMEAFQSLLEERNRVMNLTAVTDELEAVSRHYLDSLAPLSLGLLRQGMSLADIGTGAGFPGMPLLIAEPGLSLTFVDSLSKRLDFISDALHALGLQACIEHARAEDFGRRHREEFDVSAARAVAALPVVAEYLLPCVKTGGFALCWKGPGVEKEDAQNAMKLLGGGEQSVHPYAVPGKDWEHVLIRLEKALPTPARFPRKAGTPAKLPL